MGDPIEEKIRQTVENYLKGGGSKVADFCPECMRKDQQAELTRRDHQHELEKAQAEAEHYKEELEKIVTGHPKPREIIPHWLECPDCKPEFESLMKPKIDEAYQKGRIDSLTNPTDEETPKIKPKAIGDWIRYHRQQEKEDKS